MHHRTEQEIMQHWKGSLDVPIVSICCITYNHESYIAEAIDGFLMQVTDFPLEILIRDDCSTDKTASIVRTYADIYPNIIKPVFEKENQYSKGVKMMPVLFERAVGKYIAICEGDDYWTDPLKLHIQIEKMANYPKCTMSFHSAENMSDNSIGKTIANHSNKNMIFTASEIIIGGGRFCPTASLVFRTESLLNLPEWFYTVAPVGDYYLQILGSLKGGALFINRNMSIYRTGHPGSWVSAMRKRDEISVESLIKNRENHTFRHVKALNEIGRCIDQKHRKAIDRKISDKLFTLSILYLKNDMHQDFQKMIVRSNDACKSVSHSRSIIYYLRSAPYILKILIKL